MKHEGDANGDACVQADLFKATECFADSRLGDVQDLGCKCGPSSACNCQEDGHLDQCEGHLLPRGYNHRRITGVSAWLPQ